ncbi:MAG: hypothetical protein HC925_01270 [Coleofasciculaceae cyanobacterium SM2_3_26]|nr:hypothetical protein [Coleofasciculaceae cyanobacterium SM2_3_26]
MSGTIEIACQRVFFNKCLPTSACQQVFSNNELHVTLERVEGTINGAAIAVPDHYSNFESE